MKIAVDQIKNKIKEFNKKKKIKGYILDLRNNPGGLVISSN